METKRSITRQVREMTESLSVGCSAGLIGSVTIIRERPEAGTPFTVELPDPDETFSVASVPCNTVDEVVKVAAPQVWAAYKRGERP